MADEVKSYCPRCDKPFAAPRKRESIRLMMAHLKLAHPDYYIDYIE